MKTPLSILSLAAFVASPVLAEPSYDSLPEEPTNLYQQEIVGPLVVEALRNSPSLVAAEKRYQAARASIDSAAALPNPSVQITQFVESIQTRTGPQRQAIMVQQPIPWLGKLRSKRDLARSQSESIWQAYASQQFSIIDRIATVAFEIAYLDKAAATTEQNIELLERLESIVENRVKSGSPLSDLLRIQLESERYRDQLAKQRTDQLVNSAKLQSLLGRNPTSEPLDFTWSAPAPVEADLHQWLDAILERSPQIAILRSLESSQENRERIAALANKADFSLGLNYIRTGDALNPETPDSGKDPWAIMVGVSLPIWGKANNAFTQQAALEKEVISAQIAELQLSLRADGQAWIARLQDAQARLVRYEKHLLPLARQAHEITESAYRSGNASILDLIETDRTLLRLDTEYWQAAADAWLARWKLATLSGGLWLD